MAVAFRLAIELQRASRDIEESDGIWAYVISSYRPTEVQERLDKINGALRPLHHAYIGQVLPGSLVVFGPPLTLDALLKASDLDRVSTSTPTPPKCLLYGLYLLPVDIAKVACASPVCEVKSI